MAFRFTVLLLTLLCVGATGCSKQSSTPEPTPTHKATEALLADSIQWYNGDIASALAAASESGKPVFAYWGAEWCPYCNKLQATVFRREEFIALSHQFVAVDMSNGDSQTIRSSDKYQIMGVPTVIIFSPEGEEITRLAGGDDLEQYAAVLEITLNAIRPVAELVASAQAGEPLSADDWYLLSSYGWIGDRGNVLGDEPASDVLQALYEACPTEQPVVCSRLGIAAMAAWLDADQETRADRATQYTDMVESLLVSPDLVQANLDALADMGDRIVEMAAPGQQEMLQARLLSLYTAAIEDPDTYLLRKSAYLGSWVDVATVLLAEGETLPTEQVAWVRRQADDAMAALDSYQVQAGVSSLWGVYYDVGLKDQARETMQYGIEKGQAPFYFMSGMAYLEQKEGNMDAALDWRRKAWENARRPLDQISWGHGYLKRLIEQTPQNYSEVERVASAIIADILVMDDGVALLTRSLDRLSTTLAEWAAADESRVAVIETLRQQVNTACPALPGSEAVTEFCAQFLEPAGQVAAVQGDGSG